MRHALAFGAFGALLVGGCGDPVHDRRVDALGGEKPGISEGPRHRAGQPCVTCHGGDGPGNATFSLAGTVFQMDESKLPLKDAIVRVVDSVGTRRETATNCVGNFFFLEDEFAPKYPVWVKVIFGTLKGVPVERRMGSPIYREGSCATCHGDAVGLESVGPVTFAPAGSLNLPVPGCPP